MSIPTDSKMSDEKAIKDLTKKRGHVKCRLTNFDKYLKSIEGTVLTVRARTEIKLRVQGVQCMYNEFHAIQSDLEDLHTGVELEKQLEAREIFESDYYTALARAQCLINDDNDDSNNDTSNAQSSDNLTASIKLPTISLPEFDGSYEHWLEYRDTFISLVHSSISIPKFKNIII